MNDDKFTNSQEETIYVCNQTENEEEIDSKIIKFFSELVDRRRDDPIEGGLQAGIVIFPEKSAMKVCEMDGTAVHPNSFINLVKHMNGDFRYISVAGTKNFIISEKERRQLIESGIKIRILDGKNELMLSIKSNVEPLSKHQIEMLNKILFYCKMLKDNQTYDSVRIGLHIPEFDIVCEDLTDEDYNNILNGINSLQKRTPSIR